MRPVIVYPLPFDCWHTFKPAVKRFTDSFREFPPGTDDYEVWAMCCWGEPTDEVREMFYSIKTKFIDYPDHGCDIGAAQWAAGLDTQGIPKFIIGMTNWCYFHRKGWLKRYMEAREKHGQALYCVSTSKERGILHACTRAYAMDAEMWWRYPHIIDRREKGPMFESGEWCLTTWAQSKQYPVIQVTWDNERPLAESRHPDEKGIFRRGDQNAMLVWDRHTDIFRDVSSENKKRLANIADFGKEEGQ